MQGDLGIDQLARQSMEALKGYFEDTDSGKSDETRAKIAATVFSAAVRYKQSLGAREALGWSMATILLDKEQLRAYVRVSMPESPLVQALPSGDGGRSET